MEHELQVLSESCSKMLNIRHRYRAITFKLLAFNKIYLTKTRYQNGLNVQITETFDRKNSKKQNDLLGVWDCI